jgi:hypothetical protein
MSKILIRKTIVKLNEDYLVLEAKYAEEIGSFSTGTEGVIINEHTIELIPNLSEGKYSELVHREVLAKMKAENLVLIDGKILSIPAMQLDHVRVEPRALFESTDGRLDFSVKIEGGPNASA